MKYKSILSFSLVFVGLFLLVGIVFLAVLSHDEGMGGPKAAFIANFFGAFAAPSFFILIVLAKLGWTNYAVFAVSTALNALLYTAFIVWLSRIRNQRKLNNQKQP
ncbi:MAG: hypothetical protein EP332_10980 [Bacteroidetes bacterium]|nr:MAG: hypothetical protein EP332_10980 [Bacteroidota bacterium]